MGRIFNLRKIIEIPIYALSKTKLINRVETRIRTIRERLDGAGHDTIEQIINAELGDNRYWDYNHIVGYIVVGVTTQDIQILVYLPLSLQKYSWKSSKKHFIEPTSPKGIHEYIGGGLSNIEIQGKISQLLTAVISEDVPKRYYVDTEVFYNIHKHLDYKALMKNAGPLK